MANLPDTSKESKDVSKVFRLTRLSDKNIPIKFKYFPDGNYDVSMKGVKITITILYKICKKTMWPSVTSFICFCTAS